MLLTVPAFGRAITKSTTTTTARMIRFRRVSIIASYRATSRRASSSRPLVVKRRVSDVTHEFGAQIHHLRTYAVEVVRQELILDNSQCRRLLSFKERTLRTKRVGDVLMPRRGGFSP